MTRIKGEGLSGFSEQPLAGPAYDRALERGYARSVRRADAIAREKETALKTLKAERKDEAPLVTITKQISKGSGRIATETSLVPAPQTRRPRPLQLSHVPIPEAPEKVGLQPDTSRGVWVGEVRWTIRLQSLILFVQRPLLQQQA